MVLNPPILSEWRSINFIPGRVHDQRTLTTAGMGGT